jgi:glycosyltransferase involved in cell wall biosynthesis
MSVSKLCEELVKSGEHLEVLTTTANGERELNVKPGVKKIVNDVPVTYFRRLTRGNSHLSPALILALWKNLKPGGAALRQNIRPSPVVVHVHAWWNMVSVLSCMVAILLSRPVLLSPRGTLSGYSFGNRKSFVKNIFHQTIGKAMLNRCHFHVSTEKEKQDILKIFSPRSICVVENFVELPITKFVNTNYLDVRKNNVFKLVFLSRVEEKKGLDILFKELQKLSITYHLTIAGTGDLNYVESLKVLSSELGIQESISWIGHQSNRQKFQLLAEHDLMVLPSHDESFANVVIESLFVGTAVLISSNVGLSDYILSNNMGWVYEHSRENIADNLEAAFKNKSKRISIRTTAPKKIATDFNEEQILKKYLELYREIFYA